MTNLTNLQLHYDKANEGRCLVCGCTMNSREYYCRYCIEAEEEEMLKKNVAKGDPDSAELVEEGE